MEFMPHGDLQTVLASRDSHLPEYQCQLVALQMCQALKYLHDRDICHRDVKPDNILIYSHDPYVFKLSDFGLSKIAPPDQTNLETFCGTMLYCAPEVYPGYARLCQQMELSGLVQKTPRKRRRARNGRYVGCNPVLTHFGGLMPRQLSTGRRPAPKDLHFGCRYMGIRGCPVPPALRQAPLECQNECLPRSRDA